MPTINGYWAKAWDGYLRHFWVDDHKTLCGQTHMFPHFPGHVAIPARAVCKRCQKNYDALLAAQEKGAAG